MFKVFRQTLIITRIIRVSTVRPRGTWEVEAETYGGSKGIIASSSVVGARKLARLRVGQASFSSLPLKLKMILESEIYRPERTLLQNMEVKRPQKPAMDLLYVLKHDNNVGRSC